MEADETEDETLEILYQVVEHSEAFWIPAREENHKYLIMIIKYVVLQNVKCCITFSS